MPSAKKGKPKKRVRFEGGIVSILRNACYRSAQKGYLLLWFACVAIHCVLILLIETVLMAYEKLTFRGRRAQKPPTGIEPAATRPRTQRSTS